MILALAAVYVVLDWARLCSPAGQLALSPISNALKLATSFLATGIAWSIGKDELEPGDARQFRLCFALSFIADVCFVVGVAPAGILLFAGFQVLLSRRSLRGARAAWRTRRLPRGRLAMLGTGVLAVTATYLTLLVPHIEDPVLVIAIPIYAMLLCGSVISAWTATWIGRLPAANALLAAIGMTLFYCCDLTVGVNLVLDPTLRPQIWSTSLTWMFYAPALVCIALSGYRAEHPVQGAPA